MRAASSMLFNEARGLLRSTGRCPARSRCVPRNGMRNSPSWRKSGTVAAASEQRRNVQEAAVVGHEYVSAVPVQLLHALHAHAYEAHREQHFGPRAATRCWNSRASKKESISDSVPITMVESTIRGVEKNSERTKLIESPTISPVFRALPPPEQGARDEDGILRRDVLHHLQRVAQIGRGAQIGVFGHLPDDSGRAPSPAAAP